MKLPVLSRAQGLGVNLASDRDLSLIAEQPCNTTLFVKNADRRGGRNE